MSYIALSIQDIKSLSATAKKEIFELLGYSDSHNDSEEGDGELTKKQVINLVQGLADKSKHILKTMVLNFDKNEIVYQVLLQELDMVGENLTGVWSGITKRARTASGDPEFTLIDWVWNEELNDNVGRFNSNTYNHLKNIFI